MIGICRGVCSDHLMMASLKGVVCRALCLSAVTPGKCHSKTIKSRSVGKCSRTNRISLWAFHDRNDVDFHSDTRLSAANSRLSDKMKSCATTFEIIFNPIMRFQHFNQFVEELVALLTVELLQLNCYSSPKTGSDSFVENPPENNPFNGFTYDIKSIR